MNRPQCKRCKIPMSIGKGLVNATKRGVDFANDLDYGVTLTADTTKADLRDVWKCAKCGYSTEINK